MRLREPESPRGKISKKSLPGSDIARGDHGGARAPGGAGQVVLHVQLRLDVADELYDNNVGHCVTKLWQTESSQNVESNC